MKFRLRVRLGLYDVCPPWYAIAYSDHLYGHDVAYPIGIHWLAMAGRRIWEFSLTWPKPTRLEDELARAYSRGFADGRAEGRGDNGNQRERFT